MPGGAIMRTRILLALTAFALATAASAQTQTPPQKPPAQTAPPPAATIAPAQAQPPVAPKPQASPPATPAPRISMAVTVTDLAGEAAPGVHVALSGPVAREGTTARDGLVRFQTLRVGTYRLRFESPDFVTFEREVTVKAGPVVEVEVTLSRAPEKPVAPPLPAPVQAAANEPAPVPPNPNATVDLVELPDWIEKNLIGRSDPQRETVVGRAPGATARVLQVREPIKDRVRGDADEMLYVIAGEGLLRAKGRDYDLTAGSFAVIPRGVSYTLERRGRNALIALSMVSK
jgi:mannose-6-phosphate isomerase-like protein (cupin superfamily)